MSVPFAPSSPIPSATPSQLCRPFCQLNLVCGARALNMVEAAGVRLKASEQRRKDRRGARRNEWGPKHRVGWKVSPRGCSG
eukprot:11399629-Alexandrium_andersonii.AAC.1